MKRLEEAGELDNTYIFYSSDNGYHISQHRMHPGKECGFETDINIPLIVRGPGIPAGSTQNVVSSHTDLAPTMMQLAGNEMRESFDGQPINLHEEDNSRPEHLGVEFWGLGVPEGRYGYKGKYGYDGGFGNAYQNNTYKGLRIESADYSFYYSVWCTNEAELYDMKQDPGQLNNILGKSSAAVQPSSLLLGRNLERVVERLDALMMVLKSCKGKECVDPWKSIHPRGDVRSLADAVSQHFDAFYAKQPKVSFSKCELGYIREAEGPQEFLVYRGDEEVLTNGEQQPLIDPDWSVWT